MRQFSAEELNRLNQAIAYYISNTDEEIVTREAEWGACGDEELKDRFLKGMAYIQNGKIKKWSHLSAHAYFNKFKEDFWTQVEARNLLHPEVPWTFETLYATVRQIGRQLRSQGLKGFGDMTVFDITLFLGARWGLRPLHLYLHRGPKKGAELLGIGLSRKPKSQPYAEHFPRLTLEQVWEKCPALRPLGSAFSLENFLCHYPHLIKKLFPT